MPFSFIRRKFLTTGTAALAATQLAVTPQQAGARAADPDPGTLAKHGGPRAVQAKAGPRVRWGDAEKLQLSAAVDQPSMFYWAGTKPNRQTALFIERFAEYCPYRHVVTCSSGTAAVHIAVAAAGIGPGDEVITTPISDIGTITGILFQQGVPVFADLGASTYNLDPQAVERAITPRTKAIVAVHLTGNPCDMTALRGIADRHELVLIEDCAQAWGARYRGRPVGTLGHVACYSLQDGKHIATGDGGVVASSDPRIGPALQKFSDKGLDRFADPKKMFALTDVLATNYRMSELQAGFGAVQLQRLEAITAKRAMLGRLLIEGISGLPAVMPPAVDAADRCAFWFFYFRLRLDRLKCDRAAFVEALRSEGMSCNEGYIPVPLYKMPYFQNHAFFGSRWPVKELGLTEMDYTRVTCPEAEAILATGVQCPLNESMDETLIREMGTAVRKVAKHYTV